MFAQGLRFFAVQPDLVTPETRTQVRPALPDHICPEHPRVAVEVPHLDLEAPGKVLDRRPQELHTAGNLAVAGKGVVLAAKGIVHPVVPTLDQQRGARRQHRRNQRAGHRALEIDAVEAPVRQPAVALKIPGRESRLELQDAARRVASEQGSLGAAQDLDPFDIEDRDALEKRVFQRNAVEHDRDRLGGVHIEVGIAQAANVETRRDAAKARFDLQAGSPVGQETDVHARGAQPVEPLAPQHGQRQRHVEGALLLLAGGDGDLLKCLLFGWSARERLLRGGRRGAQ